MNKYQTFIWFKKNKTKKGSIASFKYQILDKSIGCKTVTTVGWKCAQEWIYTGTLLCLIKVAWCRTECSSREYRKSISFERWVPGRMIWLSLLAASDASSAATVKKPTAWLQCSSVIWSPCSSTQASAAPMIAVAHWCADKMFCIPRRVLLISMKNSPDVRMLGS